MCGPFCSGPRPVASARPRGLPRASGRGPAAPVQVRGGSRSRRAAARGPRPASGRPGSPGARLAPGPRSATASQRFLLPRRTRPSARTRSASTSAALGRPPALNAAIAAGRSRSGSGVSDSQASLAGLDMRGTVAALVAFDYKVKDRLECRHRRPGGASRERDDREPDHPADHRCRRQRLRPGARRPRARASLLPGRGGPEPRDGHGLRAQLAVRGPRRRARRAQHLHHHPRRRPARPGGPHRGRRAARLPQRLPPPRLRAAHRRRQVQARDPLPLSRLDLRLDRRPVDGGPRAPRLRGARQVEARADARARRGPCRLRLRQPRSRGEAAGRAHAGLAERLERYRIPELEMFGTKGGGGSQPANWKIVVENYLEGYHVPIAHPGPDAAARLSALRGRAPRGLVLVRGAAPRHPVVQPHGAALPAAGEADDGPGRGRPHGLALLRHLPQHRDRPLSRPGQRLADPPGRPELHRRRVGLLPRGEPRAGDAAGPAHQPALQHRGPGRGRRPGQRRPDRDPDQRVHAGPAVGARGRRRLVRGPDPRRRRP